MKNLFVLLIGILFFCTELVFADSSPGKPGAKVAFTDKQVIQLQPSVPQELTLELISSADQLEYTLHTSDALDIQLLDGDIYTKNKPLKIRLQIKSNQVGRFYIHCQVTTKTGDEILVSTISRVVVSSDTDQAATSLTASAPYDLRLNKTNSTGDYKILPSTESVSTAVDKQDE